MYAHWSLTRPKIRILKRKETSWSLFCVIRSSGRDKKLLNIGLTKCALLSKVEFKTKASYLSEKHLQRKNISLELKIIIQFSKHSEFSTYPASHRVRFSLTTIRGVRFFHGIRYALSTKIYEFNKSRIRRCVYD